MKNLKLKLARMEKDMSQTELAKRVGVTRQTIGMAEAGDYNPTLKLCIHVDSFPFSSAADKIGRASCRERV